MNIIINADDFGYSEGVNYGIIEAFKQGMVTSTTLLTTMPGSKHACSLAKEYPQLDVGIHLTLDLGTPTLPKNKVPSLIKKDGTFKSFSEWKSTFDFVENEIYTEWKNQIETAIANGVEPSHLDSHHHIHMMKPIFFTFIKLAREYNLAIRFHPKDWSKEELLEIQPDLRGLRRAQNFTSGFYSSNATADFFHDLPLTTNETWEIDKTRQD